MWHLLRSNLKGRKAYNAIIVSAVALALTVVLSAALMTRSVQKELEHKQQLLGPELAVVPPGTKERGHIYLTKGPPGHGLLPANAAQTVRNFSEVDEVTVQKLTGFALVGNERAMLIAFDPATDFMVLPWLGKKTGTIFQDPGNEVLLGTLLEPEKAPGDTLLLDKKSYTVSGRLRETGSFMDSTAFFPMPPEQFSGEPSWILLSLKPGSSVDVMINTLETNIDNIEVISRPEMLKTINDQLHGVVQGGGLNVAALLVVLGALLVTGAMFALLVYERRRELGLLKAMGAKNSFVFRLIIGEAVVLSGTGGLLGILLSAVWLCLTGTEIVSAELSLLHAFSHVLGRVALALALTMAVGVITALFPALLAARMEPYAAIRSGE